MSADTTTSSAGDGEHPRPRPEDGQDIHDGDVDRSNPATAESSHRTGEHQAQKNLEEDPPA